MLSLRIFQRILPLNDTDSTPYDDAPYGRIKMDDTGKGGEVSKISPLCQTPL